MKGGYPSSMEEIQRVVELMGSGSQVSLAYKADTLDATHIDQVLKENRKKVMKIYSSNQKTNVKRFANNQFRHGMSKDFGTNSGKYLISKSVL